LALPPLARATPATEAASVDQGSLEGFWVGATSAAGLGDVRKHPANPS
jgi:hypothetical protein